MPYSHLQPLTRNFDSRLLAASSLPFASTHLEPILPFRIPPSDSRRRARAATHIGPRKRFRRSQIGLEWHVFIAGFESSNPATRRQHFQEAKLILSRRMLGGSKSDFKSRYGWRAASALAAILAAGLLLGGPSLRAGGGGEQKTASAASHPKAATAETALAAPVKVYGTGSHYYVKSPVFPWNKFPGVDTVLGPGDEVDRRSDGRGRQLWRSVRQGAAGRGPEVAHAGSRSSSA